MARASQKIGLLDHLGGGNLGDDATLDAVMQNIKMRWPDAEIFGFSMNPSDTQTRHGIPTYPIRKETWTPGFNTETSKLIFKEKVKAAAGKYDLLFKILKALYTFAYRKPVNVLQELRFLAKSFRIIRSFDLLIIAGGGQLLDSWGGPWKFPYTIFKWTMLAKFSGAKCYFINVGAGPLSHPLGKWFVKRALFRADYVSFRDDQSRTLVNQAGYKTGSHVCPDNVYSLEIPALTANRNGERGESIVGLSPMAYCDPRIYWEKNQNVYDSFIRELAAFGSWLVRNQQSLVLFSTDIWFDSQAIEDLKAAMTKGTAIANSPRIRHEPIPTIEEMFSQMSSLDYLVTCRFHGVIFAHMLNKPVLALSHHPKVTKLMSEMGLSNYCLDIHTCDFKVLAKAFQTMVSDRDEIKSRMAEKLASNKRELTMQFDALFPREARSQTCVTNRS